VCSICGETLEGVSQTEQVQSQINSKSGALRAEADNEEIHRCEMPSQN
jgi:hypothetical protein